MRKFSFILLFALSNFINADGGYYIGIGGGYSSLTGTVQSPYQFANTTSSSQSAGSFASTLYFGYDFNRWVGLQAEYNAAWAGQYSNSYSINQQLLGGSILLHFPFSVFSDSLNGLSVYAKGGYDYNAINFGAQSSCSGCLSVPSAAYGSSPMYGLGAEYGFKNIGYRLEWDYAGALMATSGGNNLVSTTSNSYFVSILYHF